MRIPAGLLLVLTTTTVTTANEVQAVYRSPDQAGPEAVVYWQGEKTENARISVYHNGILVHEKVELDGGTGRGGTRAEVPREHLYLQAHRGPGFFRNVWLIPDADQWPAEVQERLSQDTGDQEAPEQHAGDEQDQEDSP